MSNERFQPIDAARGLAVLAMIQTHAYDGWVLDSERASLGFRITRVLGTLPLPMFLLLAGVGLALRAHTDAARGLTAKQTRLAIMQSALRVVGMGYALSAAYALLNGARGLDAMLRPDVLHAIGLSLLVLAWLGVGSRLRLVVIASLLTLVPVVICPALTPLGKGVNGSLRLFAGLFVEIPGVAHMPLIPLLSFCATGVGLGLWLTHGPTVSPAIMRRKLLILAGLGFVLTLIGSLSSDLARASGVLISRTHPSIALNVIELNGRALFVLALAALLTPMLKSAAGWLVACGRHSLFIYGLHLPFCYGRLVRPVAHDLSMMNATRWVIVLSAFSVGSALLLEQLRAVRAGNSAPAALGSSRTP